MFASYKVYDATPRPNREFKNRDREQRSSCNNTQTVRFVSKKLTFTRECQKKDTIRGVSGGASYIQQQPDFDLTDYSWAGERMRYPSLNSPSLSLLRLLQHQITCSIHQMFFFFGELSKSKRRSKVACIYEGLNGVNR